jgi:CubicO group peptidase (beta-lactamase class C family)
MASKRWLFPLLPLAAIVLTAMLDPALTRRLIKGPGVGAGIAAELGCAGVFVMGRAPADVLAQDLAPTDPLLARVTLTVDHERQSVTAGLLSGLVSRTALYRPGLGCTLIDGNEAELRHQAVGLTPMSGAERPTPWPAGDAVDFEGLPPTIDRAALDAAVSGAFDETAAGGKIDTRAILVAWRGRIIAERYAPGFGKDTPMLGWSMGKSVTSALIGTLVADGKLALDAPPPVPALAQAKDGRETITLKQLLQMRGGLAFEESYEPGDDATTMLFGSTDMALYAATRPLAHPPGGTWSYSSGTANILAHLVFDAAGGDVAREYDYARQHLFEPAGMTSAVFEPDGIGNFVGSSYLYMTARDWARLGQLYLDGGTINGRGLLPQDWVAFSHAQSGPIDEAGGYGAMFWLNSDGASPPKLRWPHCPPETYMAMGHNDEIVAIVPRRQVVFVRLGWTTGAAEFDTDTRLSQILESIPE